MRSFEKSFEAQASAPVEARMIAAADATHSGTRGRHHFAFEIVLDEARASSPQIEPAPILSPSGALAVRPTSPSRA